MVWEQFHNKECTILCIELLLKYIGNDNSQLIKIAAEVRILANKSANLYNDAEIASSCLLITQKILGIPGKSEYWQILLTQGIIDQINTYLQKYLLNNEIVSSSLKIILAYSFASAFTRTVASILNIETISHIFSIYFMERTKVKAISQILSEIIIFVDYYKIKIIFEMLLKIIKRSFDFSEIIQAIFKGFCKIVKLKNVSDIFINDKSIEIFTELLIHIGGDIAQYEDLLEFIYVLGVTHEKIKLFIWKNEEVNEVLSGLKNLTLNSSTGSSLYNPGTTTFQNMLMQIIEYSKE